jgi:DNA polymerase
MYHPAAALHQGSLRKVIEADFGKLPGFLEKALAGDLDAPAQRVPAHLRKDSSTPETAATESPPTDETAAAATPDPQQMRLL